MTEKIKENATQDFLDMIFKSWTWAKMTKEEKDIFIEQINHIRSKEAIKGTYQQRWIVLQALYGMYLQGIGYGNNPKWRD